MVSTNPDQHDVPGADSATGVDDPTPDRDYGDDTSGIKMDHIGELSKQEQWPDELDEDVRYLSSAVGVDGPGPHITFAGWEEDAERWEVQIEGMGDGEEMGEVIDKVTQTELSFWRASLEGGIVAYLE